MYRSTEPYYTGHPYDGSLNIYFAENRFYDAETGAWLSPDPIKDGLNWYAYCGNNPMSYIDITGLLPNDPSPAEFFKPLPKFQYNPYYSVYDCEDDLSKIPNGGQKTYWETFFEGIFRQPIMIVGEILHFAHQQVLINMYSQRWAIEALMGNEDSADRYLELKFRQILRGAIVANTIVTINSDPPEFGKSLGESISNKLIDTWKIISGNDEYAKHQLAGESGEFAFDMVLLLVSAAAASGKFNLNDTDDIAKFLNNTDDIGVTKYSPVNPGPLKEEVANTFNGGTYTERVLTEDTVMYRVNGGKVGGIGSYMSKTPQSGGLQSQLDLALNPDWGNTAENVTKVVVPKGTTIYEGIAAPQNIYDSFGNVIGRLPGGGNQVYIPSVEVGWFQ